MPDTKALVYQIYNLVKQNVKKTKQRKLLHISMLLNTHSPMERMSINIVGLFKVLT